MATKILTLIIAPAAVAPAMAGFTAFSAADFAIDADRPPQRVRRPR